MYSNYFLVFISVPADKSFFKLVWFLWNFNSLNLS